LLSATSNTLYQINGKCAAENGEPCKGYTYNNGICYHRALKQLIVLYNEPVSQAAEREKAILVKRSGNVMRIDGWDV
jgi:hypothetical protein